MHQQALRIDEDVALSAHDLLAASNPPDRCRSPFSALLTLWLSMIAASARLASGGFATLHVERIVDAIERAVPIPAIEES